MNDSINIKSMKLYNNVERIFNELREIGKSTSSTLLVEDLTKFDQLHYHGTDAIDIFIEKLEINEKTKILDVGSGIGGPARYLADKTGAEITAIELQSDQNNLAKDLTKKCGLSNKVNHIYGDILDYDFKNQTFDAVVSWLTLYHIANHEILLKKLFDLLNPNGFFYTEDITSRINLSDADRKEIKKEIYGIHLPYFDNYISNLEQNGFKLIFSEDMSSSWTDFTKERIKKYNSEKERNIRVHGKEVYDSLNLFYNFVGQYFSNGKLGGIRVIAKKLSTSYSK
jgi:cyclopropane fatty-acyl-phospholipid synthase-like methyltransferase